MYTDHRSLLGAFQSRTSQQYDAVAMNHIQKIAMRTSDIRYISAKQNTMADWLSRPQHVPEGTAYQLQDEEEGVAALETVTLE